MISKELLNKVLGYAPYKILPITNVSGVGTKTLICENEDGTVRAYWNIYELAHKCKEWAYNKGWALCTQREFIYEGYSCDVCHEQDGYCKKFVMETEPEAIFKAWE